MYIHCLQKRIANFFIHSRVLKMRMEWVEKEKTQQWKMSSRGGSRTSVPWRREEAILIFFNNFSFLLSPCLLMLLWHGTNDVFWPMLEAGRILIGFSTQARLYGWDYVLLSSCETKSDILEISAEFKISSEREIPSPQKNTTQNAAQQQQWWRFFWFSTWARAEKTSVLFSVILCVSHPLFLSSSLFVAVVNLLNDGLCKQCPVL